MFRIPTTSRKRRARLPARRSGRKRLPRSCRWSRSLRRLVRLDLTRESLSTMFVPDAWTATGRRSQECRRLKKHFRQRQSAAAEVAPQRPEAEPSVEPV
eukprot:3384179-Amphidinium_carterae.1